MKKLILTVFIVSLGSTALAANAPCTHQAGGRLNSNTKSAASGSPFEVRRPHTGEAAQGAV